MTTIQSSNLLAQRFNNDTRMPVSAIQINPVSNENEPKAPLKKPSLALVGLSLAIPILSFPAVNFITRSLIKNDKELGINVESVKKALEPMLTENKLKDKGVTAHFAAEGSEDAKALLKGYGGGAYFCDSKQLHIMEEKASLSLHEAGHAINHNCSKIGEMYSKVLKKLPKFVGGPLGLAIWSGLAVQLIGQIYTKPQQVNGQPKEEKHPILKFLHNNMGKLTFLAFVPMLLDEGFATVRALKSTKKFSSEILKPVRKNLLLAGATYALITAGNIVSTLLNRKYSDENKAYQQG